MKKRRNARAGLALLAAVGFAACGGDAGAGGDAAEGAAGDTPATADAGGGDATELARKIGPIAEVELGPIEAALAERGEAAFQSKCSACHKLDERYVGPPLGDVTERRAPEFVMNMMLNPEGMVRDHPEVKAMLAQYYTPMPNQNLTRDEARAILEYLRHEAAEAAAEADEAEDADASEMPE
jgi:cytochrome c